MLADRAHILIRKTPFAPYGSDVPGMQKIVYLGGWVNILAAAKALPRADEPGNLTPEGVREAIEKLDFDRHWRLGASDHLHQR
jgi:hypothetical protein